ncbi:hypothetical protein EZV62_001550 [Acer yangbiense]|uniref:NB-ARC domain-containing protein n=1 Tax=Acer yangbiense TaxID=1000413 RepID=A0A5C7IUM1_9ROSI|nr:hypothetical protein EZV62_001550 [Acer yangbiense]
MDDCEGMLLQHLHDCVSLSTLCISKVSSLACLPDSSLKNITALRVLKLSNCSELVTLWEGTGSDNFCSLQRFEVWCCQKLISLPEELPPILQHLKLMYCSNLESLSQGMHHIPLVDFEICNVDKLTSFPEVRLPNTLKRLVIKECKNLQHLPNSIHNLTSLELLEIRRCPLRESFPGEGLPVTLKWISIFKCDNLRSLPDELHNLISLKELRISNVPKLASLPDCGLPTMLSYLDIDACPLLIARCNKEDGDWFKVAHVPNKRIDGKEIF